MKFNVNEDCIACCLCATTCPEVFRIVDGRSRAMEGDVPAEAEAAALEAMESCPVNAIETIA